MRVARLLSIVFEVDARPGITAAELAGELGVSRRTVYRDVAALQVAGIPLYGTNGRNGGFRLVDGYRSGAAALGATEAAALLAGIVPDVAAQLGLGADAERALRKVRAQSGVATLGGGQLLVDPVGWYRTMDDVPHLTLVAEAMRTRTVLAVRYSRWADPTEVRRRIAPHGIVLKAGAWYVMARSRRRMRTYRVSQLVDARLTRETFEPDADFDLAAGWSDFLASFRDRLHVIDAHVLLDEAACTRIRQEGDPTLCEALAATAVPVDDEPWTCEAALPFESIERAVSELLRFGTGVHVLGPPDLHDRIESIIGELTDRYTSARRAPSVSSPGVTRK